MSATFGIFMIPKARHHWSAFSLFSFVLFQEISLPVILDADK